MTDSVPMAETESGRDRILEAAIAAIDEGGEAGLRTEEIARVSGISRASIYHFFGDRDGLVAAAQAERYRRSIVVSLGRALEVALATTSREEFAELLPALIAVTDGEAAIAHRADRIQVLGSAVSRPELTAEVIEATKRAVQEGLALISIPFDRGWATTGFDVDAIVLWWVGVSISRHLFDLVGDERLDEQWVAMSAAAMRGIFFGADRGR